MGHALRKLKRRLSRSEPDAPPPHWYNDAVEAIERALAERKWAHGLVVLTSADGDVRVEPIGDSTGAAQLDLAARIPLQIRAQIRGQIDL